MSTRPAVWWPYNETFGYYHPLPLAGKRAEAFVAARNREKGGTWVLHTAAQYEEWWGRVGRFLEEVTRKS